MPVKMPNLDRYPPYSYLIQVADHCPRAMATFLILWREKPNDLTLKYSKEDVSSHYLISWTKFKNDLRQLAREGLLIVEEYPNSVTVTLEEGIEIDAEGLALC